MDPLSPRARALVSAYRKSTTASEELRANVRRRLDRSTKPRRPAWLLPVAAVTAVAAAAILWIGQSLRTTPTQIAEDDYAAPFVHEREAEVQRARVISPHVESDSRSTEEAPDLDSAHEGDEPEASEPSAPSTVADAPPPRSHRGSTGSAETSDATPPAGPDLAAEMAVLRRAGSLVRAGDGRPALAALDEHARRFPSGQLIEDREALRVQALCAAGDPAAARSAARAFEAAHPTSPHLGRVRSAAGSCDDSSSDE